MLDADQYQYVWIALFAIGALLLFAAIFKKTSLVKLPQVPAAFIGFLLLCFGFIWGLNPYMAAQDQFFQAVPSGGTTVIIDGEDIVAPAFSIDASAVITNVWDTSNTVISTAVMDATETILTVPLTVNLGTGSAEFACNYTAMNFSVTPIPPTGANADDLATIYFESDYNMKYAGEYVLDHDGNEETFDATWIRCGADTTTWEHNGQDTMLFTDSAVYQLWYELNSGSTELTEDLQTVGETVSWSATLHNADWSWSQVYTITAIVIASA